VSSVLEEMRAVLEGGPDALMHYGTKFHSGRYPYGSGDQPFQHEGDFLTRIERLKKEEGFKETADEVKKHFGMKLEDYRNEKYWAEFTRKEQNIVKAKNLRDKGLGNSAIGKEMGVNESTVRSWLNPKTEANMMAAKQTADFLKEQIAQKGMLDVGKDAERFINVGEGAEKGMGISRTKLDQALYALESEGYHIYKSNVPQPNNPGKYTLNMTLCPPGTPYQDVYNKRDQIHTIEDFKYQEGIDGFKKKFTYPSSLDSSRLKVLLADDLGTDGRPSKEKDGIIELRRGVEDLDLQGDQYSQVRILVDNAYYLKGMAVYSDNMPDGVDVVFNTSKTEMSKALKKIKEDPDNPFGTTIKDADDGGQYWYKDSKTGEEKLGLINKKSTQGDWSEWDDNLPSQFLSKQSTKLAERQLGLAADDRYAEFESICSINNPTIKKHFLQSFADDCDGAAVNLKAAALPNQKYHVIVPMNNQKDTEIYAPSYKDGTKLALVRYPHGGIFEIPVLTVNNKNKQAKQMLGEDAIDVVGITTKVAEQLSGADFDGDTVMCIPTDYGRIRINRSEPLKGLVGFDNKAEYGTKLGDDGEYYNARGEKVKIMTNTNMEMGKISNLITDMTLHGGASDEEMTRAIKHSMVVIDAEKHKLDYKRSEVENNIPQLISKYQRTLQPDGTIKEGGASTIISKAKGVEYVNKRRGQARIDPETGKKTYLDALPSDLYYVKKDYDKKTGMITVRTADGKKITYNSKDPADREMYEPVGKYDKDTGIMTFTNKAGTIRYNTETREQKSTKMAETDDARTLMSADPHPMEMIYANYANSMKALANEARKEMLATGNLKYDANAKKVYQTEVDSLMARLNEAEKNTVRERQAARLTTAEVKQKMADAEARGEELSGKQIRKYNQQALTKYRQQVGSVSRRERSLKISDREWEAIQAGAISENKLKRILANADADELRQRATPRTTKGLTTGQAKRIQTLSASGNYTIAEIAEQLGVSTSTVSKYMKGVD
jgi:DNA-binding NarL/FixJ family response regulator